MCVSGSTPISCWSFSNSRQGTLVSSGILKVGCMIRFQSGKLVRNIFFWCGWWFGIFLLALLKRVGALFEFKKRRPLRTSFRGWTKCVRLKIQTAHVLEVDRVLVHQNLGPRRRREAKLDACSPGCQGRFLIVRLVRILHFTRFGAPRLAEKGNLGWWHVIIIWPDIYIYMCT